MASSRGTRALCISNVALMLTSLLIDITNCFRSLPLRNPNTKPRLLPTPFYLLLCNLVLSVRIIMTFQPPNSGPFVLYPTPSPATSSPNSKPHHHDTYPNQTIPPLAHPFKCLHNRLHLRHPPQHHQTTLTPLPSSKGVNRFN